MKIHSHNEWDPLKEIIVGTAAHANWPVRDPVWANERLHTAWRESDPPVGPVPDWIIEETEEDLASLCDILRQAGVTVHRASRIDYQKTDGFSGYCPRDRILIAGNVIVDVAMMYPSRNQEVFGLEILMQHQYQHATMPWRQSLVCDAANICRLGDSWLFLESRSGNRAAAAWLAARFPDIHIHVCNFYQGVHIDSTVVPLREGVVMLNASRVTEHTVPEPLRNWDKIWIQDCVAQDFYQYPFASKWIGMNSLSIDPNTVIVDAAQTEIIKLLEQRHFTVIPHTLRHSRTLGGGHHCVTLDLWRQHD
jgi:scyllo-inosamine-4-phosphate amidinotransferase 1